MNKTTPKNIIIKLFQNGNKENKNFKNSQGYREWEGGEKTHFKYRGTKVSIMTQSERIEKYMLTLIKRQL